ncbi:hypothetical protein GCM10009555_070810 [Acrocarpospora macrocephala]
MSETTPSRLSVPHTKHRLVVSISVLSLRPSCPAAVATALDLAEDISAAHDKPLSNRRSELTSANTKGNT